jgi:hypothetical protein
VWISKIVSAPHAKTAAALATRAGAFGEDIFKQK